jgi:Spy/CpxP family protein refolding chaperone
MSETNPTLPTPTPSTNAPANCRRRGRGAFFALLGIAALLAFGAFEALGHGPFGMRACGQLDPARVEKKIDRVAGWIVEDLDGTPEQQAQLAAIAKAAAKDLAPIHDELVAGRREAVEILTAETVDRAALEAHRARQMQLVTEASGRLTAAVADAADVLTPAQREKAAERLAARMARFGH